MNNKPIALEDLAEKIDGVQKTLQKDISLIRQDMVTKDEFKTELQKIQREMNGMTNRMATKEDLENYATRADVRAIVDEAKIETFQEFRKFKYAKEIDSLNVRVTSLEEKSPNAEAI